jgi:hypothetical protein
LKYATQAETGRPTFPPHLWLRKQTLQSGFYIEVGNIQPLIQQGGKMDNKNRLVGLLIVSLCLTLICLIISIIGYTESIKRKEELTRTKLELAEYKAKEKPQEKPPKPHSFLCFIDEGEKLFYAYNLQHSLDPEVADKIRKGWLKIEYTPTGITPKKYSGMITFSTETHTWFYVAKKPLTVSKDLTYLRETAQR